VEHFSGMDADAKKTALRMIPYGLYVLTTDDGQGTLSAATVNWVTQASFAPPLVAVGVKADSHGRHALKDGAFFALCMLGKDQKDVAYTFFKPTVVADGKLSGQAYHKGTTGVPILDGAIAAVECRVTSIVEAGDHHVVIAEAVEAHVMKAPAGRPDAAILEMKDLGDNVFYGG
jgi:flavin reductase (DIM6/NTAB) family NADH-FMN oxidoreductase RutF